MRANFGENLARLLAYKKVSWSSVCSGCGIAINNLQGWKKNGNIPSQTTRNKIADFLKMDVEELTKICLGVQEIEPVGEIGLPVKNFHDHFEKILIEKGISFRQLAKETGTSRNCLNYWKESGKFPSYEVLVKYAQYLDVSIEALTHTIDYRHIPKYKENLMPIGDVQKPRPHTRDEIKLLTMWQRATEEQRTKMLFACAEILMELEQ